MASSKLKITYTPVHGVGSEYAKMAFAAFGLRPFVSVVEQVNALLFLQYTIHVAAGLKIV
jgi:phosphomannomutase